MTALECERGDFTHTQPSKILRLPHVEEGGGRDTSCTRGGKRKLHVARQTEEEPTSCTRGGKRMIHTAHVDGKKCYILCTWKEGRKNMIHTLEVRG